VSGNNFLTIRKYDVVIPVIPTVTNDVRDADKKDKVCSIVRWLEEPGTVLA